MSENESSTKDMIANIILAAAFAATFLCIFFFTYTKNVERTITTKNVDIVIDELFGFLSICPAPVKIILKEKLSKIKIEMKEQDDAVENSNKHLLKLTAMVITPYLIISLIIAFFLIRNENNIFVKTICSNLYLLCGIILVQYVFLKYIASSYISADPNYVKYKFLDMLKSHEIIE